MSPPASPRRPVPHAVIFGAGNTLIRMNYAAIAAHLADRGHPATDTRVREAEVRARVRLDVHLAPGASTESGAIHRLYMHYLLEHLGITDADEVEAIARWRREYNRPLGLWNRADPDAATALARIRRSGRVVGVISNSDGSARAILEAVGLAGHLDFVIDSAVVGVEKPDPHIFAIALREAGVSAAEAVYVGDLYSVDVLGARSAGLDAILLDPLGLWAPRDCRLAAGLADAVHAILGDSAPGDR